AGWIYLEEEFYRAKISELEKKRLNLQEELGRLRMHAEKYKEVRDKKNNEVKAVIQTLKEVREKRREKLDELRRLREELREVKDELARAVEKIKKINRERFNGEDVKRRIESLEWMIQTAPLSLDEEKKIVAEIARLEEEALEAEERRRAYERAVKCLEDLRKRRGHVLARLDELRGEVAEFDEKIKVLEEKFNEVKGEADKAHRNYMDLFEKVIVKENELEKLVDEEKIYRRRYLRIVEKKKEEEEKERKRILEKKAAEAKEKFRRGEKVSIHELRAAFLGDES
ncbi:MAG: hypothetical protein KIH01_05310, partial [Candidatus Freyarchaeota archaeon]|nr:hypothetical protein [Candidatus Jordarchaeia archaeon]